MAALEGMKVFDLPDSPDGRPMKPGHTPGESGAAMHWRWESSPRTWRSTAPAWAGRRNLDAGDEHEPDALPAFAAVAHFGPAGCEWTSPDAGLHHGSMHRVSKLENWPEDVAVHILGAHGEPESVERLDGMSLARVYRVRFEDGSRVVKASPRGEEMRFYENIADPLRAVGVPIPLVEWTGYRGGEYWVVMEDVPGELTGYSVSGEPDRRIVRGLAFLHRATREATFEFEHVEVAWDDEATRVALTFFDDEASELMRPALDALRKRAEGLREPWCWISGDASPTNWGARDDGTAVLFDWELFRPGVPASDLATAVPGLPSAGAFEAMADAYLDEAANADFAAPWERNVLARDAVVAKAATVVALLAAQASLSARVPEEYVTELVDTFPAWLATVPAAFDIG